MPRVPGFREPPERGGGEPVVRRHLRPHPVFTVQTRDGATMLCRSNLCQSCQTSNSLRVLYETDIILLQ